LLREAKEALPFGRTSNAQATPIQGNNKQLSLDRLDHLVQRQRTTSAISVTDGKKRSVRTDATTFHYACMTLQDVQAAMFGILARERVSLADSEII
jgi:hypothetical protein